MVKEWGFDKLIPLITLKDATNGYLFNDSCAFGVELLAIEKGCKGDSLSLIKDPTNSTYTWKIDNFFWDKSEFSLFG